MCSIKCWGGANRKASSSAWVAKLVALCNRDYIEAALGQVRDVCRDLNKSR